MPDFNIPLSQLSIHLDEIREIGNQNAVSKRLRSNIYSMLNWPVMDDPKKKLVKDYTSVASSDDQVLLNSLFLSTIASFESFLRGLLIEVLKKLEDTELPKSLIEKNIQLSGIAMSNYFTPMAHVKIDFDNFCRNLGTIPEKTTSKLNHEIVYFVKNILSLDNLFRFLGYCNIKIDWDDFGSDERLQTSLNTKKTRDTSKALKKELENYIDTRNRIAHTGMNSADISLPQLIEITELLDILSQSLKEKCE